MIPLAICFLALCFIFYPNQKPRHEDIIDPTDTYLNDELLPGEGLLPKQHQNN